jgi:hypothetical protein
VTEEPDTSQDVEDIGKLAKLISRRLPLEISLN